MNCSVCGDDIDVEEYKNKTCSKQCARTAYLGKIIGYIQKELLEIKNHQTTR